MAKARRIRWECPSGQHPGVLGPTRPPRDSVVRYCWPCSAESGRLVERIAPALERKRAAGAARSVTKQQAKAERERAAKLAAVSAKVTDRDEPVRVDMLLAEVWRLPTRKLEAPQRRTLPRLKVRRGAKPYTTGHCYYGARIVVTVGQVDYADLVGLVIHEAAHEITWWTGRDDPGHGPLFRSIVRSLVSDWSGVQVRDRGHRHGYFFHEAMVRHLRQHPRVFDRV